MRSAALFPADQGKEPGKTRGLDAIATAGPHATVAAFRSPGSRLRLVRDDGNIFFVRASWPYSPSVDFGEFRAFRVFRGYLS